MKYVVGLSCSILLACLPTATFALDEIRLPPGFEITEYASVPNARSLALGENGTVFVSNRSSRSIYALVEQANGVRVIELLSGLKTPNGIAVHEGDLYVAQVDRVLRFDDIESQLDDPPAPVILPFELPSESHHGWRYVGFGPDGKLYISIGAPCNICDEPGYAEIVRMNPDGSDRETFARGVRNSVGMTWHPETGDLWFTDNGRDMLGDDLPPDELNHAPRKGLHFGYPYCHGGFLIDPKLGSGRSCEDYVPPVSRLGAHVAPLGLRFYTGDAFPPEYQGQLFIAEHGSWNRSKKTGYRVMMVGIVDGVAVSYAPFADGWLQGESVSGRPVDILILADGSMLLSDDLQGKVYRITYDASKR